MRVICIDSSKGKKTGELPPFKEGDTLTAQQSENYKDSFVICEYPIDKEGYIRSWLKTRFIPLSTIDETELLKERQKELV